MEEFSRSHYEVLMSFKEWASGLYGSVGNAFKNFDKEGDGVLTLSILRRACQKGMWSGDAQMLFDCVAPYNKVRQRRDVKIITFRNEIQELFSEALFHSALWRTLG